MTQCEENLSDFCANCSEPINNGICDKKGSIFQEIRIHLNNSQHNKGHNGEDGTTKIYQPLYSIYNLSHILLDLPCSDDPEKSSCDDDHAYKNIGLCPKCAASLTTLYRCFTEFNQLRKINSFLEQKIRELNNIIAKNCHPQNSHISKSVQTNPKEILQLASNDSSGPWVKLERLNCQKFNQSGGKNSKKSRNSICGSKLTRKRINRGDNKGSHHQKKKMDELESSDEEWETKKGNLSENSSDYDPKFDEPWTPDDANSNDGGNCQPNVSNHIGEDSSSSVAKDIISFPCTECEEAFWTKRSLRKHLPSHRSDNFFDCLHCEEIFRVLSDYQTHLKIHQKEKKTSRPICVTCQKDFVDNYSLRKHRQRFHPTENQSRPVNCSKCSETISGNYSFKVQSTDFSTGQKVTVQVCEKCLRSQATGQQGQVFLCGICGMTFDHSELLTEHSKTHRVAVPVEPPRSKKQSTRKKAGKNRQNSAEEAAEFVCDTCGKRFPSRRNLRTHKRSHWAFKCLHCRQRHRTAEELEIHLTKCGGLLKPFLCSTCGKRFAQKSQLEHHTLKHADGPIDPLTLTCSKCDKQFSRRSHLVRHQVTHADIKTYDCPECSQKFLTKENMTRHMDIHSSARPYQCEECGQTFRKTNYLNLHLQRHAGVKRYPCQFCEKSFSTSTQRREHEHTHTGSKPFGCTFCDKGFNQHGALARHLRTHTGDKPYKCKICGLSFPDNRPLKKHMLSHDPGAITLSHGAGSGPDQ